MDDLLSIHSNNQKLFNGLKLIQPRSTTGSLAAYDNFEFDELCRFVQVYNLQVEETITGSENYPGEMLAPKRINVDLPDEIYNCLVDYYNNAYDAVFTTISGLIRMRQNSDQPNRPIVVIPKINQYGRIRIGAEIFGSANIPKYLKNSFILAKFVQENDAVEIFPGQVQYFFEHEVRFPGKKQTHWLAYVKWFLPSPNHQTRFQCRIDDNDVESCNIELWKHNFYNISRDSIIPIHNIYCRFIPVDFQ